MPRIFVSAIVVVAAAAAAAAQNSLRVSVDLPAEVVYSTLASSPLSLISGAPGERYTGFSGFTASPDGTQHVVRAYSTIPAAGSQAYRGLTYFLNGTPIIAVGDPFPFGQGLQEVAYLSDADVNDSGEIAMILHTTTANHIVRWSAGAWTQIATDGGDPPGLPTSSIRRVLEAPHIRPDGGVVFNLKYVTPGVPNLGFGGNFGAFDENGPLFTAYDRVPLSPTTPVAGATDVFVVSGAEFGVDDTGAAMGYLGCRVGGQDRTAVFVRGEAFLIPLGVGGPSYIRDCGVAPGGSHWVAVHDVSTPPPYRDEVLVDGVPRLGESSVGGSTASLSIADLDFFNHRANDNGNWITTARSTLGGLPLQSSHLIWNGRVAFARRGTQVDLDGNGLLDDAARMISFETSHIDASDYAYVTAYRLGNSNRSAILRYDLSQLGLGQDVCGPAAANTTGRDARIELHGSSVAADDRLGLVATALPRNVFAVPLMGLAQGTTQLPSCASLACLGSGFSVRRGLVQSSGPEGWLNVEVGAQAGGAGGVVTAGQTWTYQVLYRNHVGPTTCNLTNAVALTFQ